MRWIWWSIHQHKPRTMYLGPAPMLNQCRLSGSEFTLPLFSLRCSWGIWSSSAARAFIHRQSFFNGLFGSSWSVTPALARKNNKPAGKQCRLGFLVVPVPLWPTPPPSAGPAWFVHKVPWPMEASKSSEGKYLDDPDGREELWEWGRDDGGLVKVM